MRAFFAAVTIISGTAPAAALPRPENAPAGMADALAPPSAPAGITDMGAPESAPAGIAEEVTPEVFADKT